MFSHKKGFHGMACKNRLDPGTGLVDPGAASAASAYVYQRRQHGKRDAMANPGHRRPPWLVAEVLGTVRLPNDFVGEISALLRLTGSDGNPLSTKLRKGGGLHAFLGCLTSEAPPVPGITELTLLRVDRYGGAHILH